MADPVERVRKLRTLADRTSYPAEARQARARARALMALHELSEADVAPVRRGFSVVFTGPPVATVTIREARAAVDPHGRDPRWADAAEAWTFHITYHA